MKIIFLCKYLSTGGAERVCVDVANGLVNLGHDVIIVTDTKQHFDYKPCSVIKLVHMDAAPRLSTPGMFMKLYKTLKREHPDVVVSILYRYATITKIASKLTCDCPVVASDHNSYERPKGYRMRFVQWINKFWSNYYFDYLTVLTEADVKCLNGRFRNVIAMQNPLSFKPLSEVPPKQTTVLAVGRLDAWDYKGFDILLKAWRKIFDNHKNWTLRIVGSGSEPSRILLDNLAAGMPNVEFKPFTDRIIDEYRDAEIFVLSSRYEGFGLVLTEAMSQGCACVACDHMGRQSEIVKDGKTGLICLPADVDMLASKINYLIENTDVRKKIQEAAIRSLDYYSIETVTKKWESLLLSLINKK